MTKKNSKIYSQDHILAKAIMGTIVAILITLAQLSSMPLALILNVLAVFIWIFGVNPIAYMIESIRHHRHNHKIL